MQFLMSFELVFASHFRKIVVFAKASGLPHLLKLMVKVCIWHVLCKEVLLQ